MAASRFVEVTDKEISEIKINSVPKNTKDLCKNTKTIICLRLGDYRRLLFYFIFILLSFHCTKYIYYMYNEASLQQVHTQQGKLPKR